MTRREPTTAWLAVVLCGVALLAPACTGRGLGGDAATVTAAADLQAATDRGWTAAGRGETLAEGARVRTLDGEARLEFRHGEIWLGPATRVAVHRDRVRLLAGDLVVLSSGSLTGVWDGVEVAGDAAFRLAAGVTPRVAVYAGEVTVSRPGEQRVYPRLRQADLSSARLPREPEPLRYHADDLWDRRLLASAIAFDAEAGRLARGMDREFGTAPRARAFYTGFAAVADAVLPVLRDAARSSPGAGRFGPPSDVLLTLFVAEAVAARHDLEPARVARELTSLRERGARWGLVAVAYDVTAAELAAVVDLDRDRRVARDGGTAGASAAGPGGEPPAAAPTPAGRRTPAGTRTPAGARPPEPPDPQPPDPQPADPPAPAASGPPPPPEDPDPPPAPSPGASREPGGGGNTPAPDPPPEEPPPPGESPSPEPSDLTDVVRDVIDDVAGTLEDATSPLLPGGG